MLFKREQHDGLWAVINRTGKPKIVFTNGEFETIDPEQCNYLIGLGYAYDGEPPSAEGKPPVEPPIVEAWDVWQKGKNKPVFTCDNEMAATKWVLDQDNWESMEVKKGK